MSEEDLEAESQGWWGDHLNPHAIVDQMVDGVAAGENVSFATALKVLNPSITVQCVENAALGAQALALTNQLEGQRPQLRTECRAELAEQLGRAINQLTTAELAEADVLAEERNRIAFQNHPLQVQRDAAFVADIFQFWQIVAPVLH